MTVFVAHAPTKDSSIRSQKIVSQLQRENPDHCFIPASIAFEHLYNGDFSKDEIFEIESDLLMNCDKLLIISKISKIIKREIEFAKELKNSNGEPMEVVYLAEKYREI